MRIDPPIPSEHLDTNRDVPGLVAAVASAIFAAMIISALYFGREIFVPMALAVLLTFVLAPAVHALQQYPSAAEPCRCRGGPLRVRLHPWFGQPVRGAVERSRRRASQVSNHH